MISLFLRLKSRNILDFPYIFYRYALTGEIPQENGGFKERVFWIDIGKDILETIRSYSKERYTIANYLRPYFRPRVYSIFSLFDMGPIFKRIADLLRGALSRLIIGIAKKSPS